MSLADVLKSAEAGAVRVLGVVQHDAPMVLQLAMLAAQFAPGIPNVQKLGAVAGAVTTALKLPADAANNDALKQDISLLVDFGRALGVLPPAVGSGSQTAAPLAPILTA